MRNRFGQIIFLNLVWLRISILSISILSMSTWAQLSADLFKIDMPLVNQSDSERTKAIKSGFSQVLVRVAADSKILQNADVIAASEQAQNYLTQFNYTPERTLALQFSQPAIINLLQKAQALPMGFAQENIIHVVNLQDFASFKQVQNYLRSVSGVKKVQLLSVDNNDMQLAITLAGDLQQFESALALSQKLQKVTGNGYLPMSFIWHP